MTCEERLVLVSPRSRVVRVNRSISRSRVDAPRGATLYAPDSTTSVAPSHHARRTTDLRASVPECERCRIQRRFLDRVTRSNPWWPMAISGVNAATRRALVLILHRSIEPFSLAADGSSKSQRWTRRPLRSAWLARMSSRGRR